MTREVIFGLIGVLLLYVCWQLLRLWFMARRRSAAKRDAESSQAIHSSILGAGTGPSFSSVHFDADLEPETVSPSSLEPRLSAISPLHRPVEPDPTEFSFDALLEMRQTRHRLDELFGRHESLEAEVVALRKALAEVRAFAQVSPMYGEAVALARRGFSVDAIAERCGISVAEAQLVNALSIDPTTDEKDDERG